RQRLHADLRRLPAAGRPSRRPVRAAAPFHDRHHRLQSRFAGLWTGERARAVQGLGGAVVDAVSLALLMNLFTEPGERARAMGVYGFVCAGGGSIGVLLGGLLVDIFDWHSIFLINIPIGAIVFGLSFALLPKSRGPSGKVNLDVTGSLAITASLMLAVYAIVNGN